LKAIRIQAVLSAVIFGVCLAGCGLFFAFELFLQDSGARALFVIFLAAGTAAAIWGLRAYHTLKIARLIVENSILHICPLPGRCGDAFGGEPGADVYISYFGDAVWCKAHTLLSGRRAAENRDIQIRIRLPDVRDRQKNEGSKIFLRAGRR
jgi:hypothetical protein